MLDLLYIVEQGLLNIPTLNLSRHILGRRAAYYSGLQAVTEGERWEPWVPFVREGVAETARWTMGKIDGIRHLLEETAERIRHDAEPICSRELGELIFVRPDCGIAHVVDAGIAKRQTASMYLKQLVGIGVLQEHRLGREKIFANPGFIDLLKRDCRGGRGGHAPVSPSRREPARDAPSPAPPLA